MSILLSSPDPAVIALDGTLVVTTSWTNSAGLVRVQGASWGEKNRRGDATGDLPAIANETVFDLAPGDVLHVADSYSYEAGRAGYWEVPGRSRCRSMRAAVCVHPWAFSQIEANARGTIVPAIGNGPIARYLRTTGVPVSVVDAAVPKLPRALKLPVGTPDIAYFERLFARFPGELWSGWSTDTRTPDFQHPGYGVYLACVVSQALCVLCSNDYSDEAKQPLARSLTSWGLHLAAAFSDGRRNEANGGHGLGRKALILFAGWTCTAGGMPAAWPLLQPNAFLGAVFAEDDVFYAHRSWPNGWPAGYRRNTGSEFVDRAPSTWTPSEVFQASYMPQVTGSLVGTALAMRLLGLSSAWGVAADAMVDQWMTGPAEPFRTELARAGVVGWGQDYVVGPGAGVCAAMWNARKGAS